MSTPTQTTENVTTNEIIPTGYMIGPIGDRGNNGVKGSDGYDATYTAASLKTLGMKTLTTIPIAISTTNIYNDFLTFSTPVPEANDHSLIFTANSFTFKPDQNVLSIKMILEINVKNITTLPLLATDIDPAFYETLKFMISLYINDKISEKKSHSVSKVINVKNIGNNFYTFEFFIDNNKDYTTSGDNVYRIRFSFDKPNKNTYSIEGLKIKYIPYGAV